MVFSGFEVHWNTAFHAMSFTNKTVRIMVGVTFSLQRNQEIQVSSWGADLSLEGTNWTEWSSWWWLWDWEVAGAKLGTKWVWGTVPKNSPSASPDTKGRQRLCWARAALYSKAWVGNTADYREEMGSQWSWALPRVMFIRQPGFALRIWRSGEKEDGINL